MLLGISSYTFPWAIINNENIGADKFSAQHLVQFASTNNIQFVQFGDNLPLDKLNVSELADLKDLATKNNIEIQTGARKLTLENIERFIELSIFFGSPFIRMVIDDANFYPTPAEAIHIIQQALPLLKKHNIILAIENHDRLTAVALKDIILKTDPQFVGICLDTANSLGAGDTVQEVLNVLSPYTVNLHVKDIVIKRLDHKMGFIVEGVAAGDGAINIPKLVEQLEPTGRCKTATLELWLNPSNTMEETLQKEKEMVEKSIHYLKQILA